MWGRRTLVFIFACNWDKKKIHIMSRSWLIDLRIDFKHKSSTFCNGIAASTAATYYTTICLIQSKKNIWLINAFNVWEKNNTHTRTELNSSIIYTDHLSRIRFFWLILAWLISGSLTRILIKEEYTHSHKQNKGNNPEQHEFTQNPDVRSRILKGFLIYIQEI